jgi:sporulation protein YlmC with PRC-barrel domain
LGVVEGGGLSENLSCTVTPEQLAKATTFPKNRWPAMTDSAWCADVYGAFHKKPYRPSSSKERLGEPSLARLSKVIDMGVRNREDEYLGDIKELVVQGNDGQIAYVVLSFGGSLLSDSKYFAIPTASLGFGANGEKPLLATNRQALKDTDGFDKDNWPSSASDELLAKGIAHTAKVAERERLAADIDAKNAMALSPPCMKSSEFLGRRVVNRKGEKIGRLDELMIDLPAGRVAFAVVSVAGSGGAAGRLCAVPAEAFEVSKVDDSVSLDIDAVRMAKAPVFTHSEDPIPCDRRWLGSVYKYYGIVPYWTLPDLSTIR